MCLHLAPSDKKPGVGGEWRGEVSPPAARQTRPPAAPASSLRPCSSARRASLSPAPADAAPHETTPTDGERENEHSSGHANIRAGAGMASACDR